MNIRILHVHGTGALPYLAVAYALFFVVIFVYTMVLSRRQTRMEDDLLALRRALHDAVAAMSR